MNSVGAMDHLNTRGQQELQQKDLLQQYPHQLSCVSSWDPHCHEIHSEVHSSEEEEQREMAQISFPFIERLLRNKQVEV